MGNSISHLYEVSISMALQSNVWLTIPIWVPEDPKQGTAALRAFLEKYPAGSGESLKSVDPEVWRQAIGFKMWAGNQELPWTNFQVTAPEKGDELRRKGYLSVTVSVAFPPALLEKNPEFRITYQQPLRQMRRASEFFYIPFFYDKPDPKDTSDLDIYCLKLANHSGLDFILGENLLPDRHRAVLPLCHKRPVVISNSKP